MSIYQKKTLGSTNLLLPAILTLTIKNSQRNSEYIENLKQIVLFVVEQYTYQNVSIVTYTIEKLGNFYIIVYRPSYLGNLIHSDINIVYNMISEIKLNHYYGYKYLSNNALMYHSIGVYNNKISPLKLSQFRIHNNIVFIKSNVPDTLILELQALTEKLSHRYFTLYSNPLMKSKSIDPVYSAACLEIATMFNDKVISYCNPCIIKFNNIGIIKSNNVGIINNKLWYMRTIKFIISGLIPKYTLVLPNYPLSWYKKIYRKMYPRYPFLSKYESQIIIESLIKMGDTRVVSFNFGSSKQIEEYYQMLINTDFNISKYLKLPIPGEFWNIKHNKTLKEKEFALIIKNSVLVKIPIYKNFLNTAQSLKIDYVKLIPYVGDDTDINKLNIKWKSGELMSDWGKNLHLSTGLISRFSLSL